MNGAKAELKNFIDHYFKILGSWDILHATIPIATKLMPYSPLSTLSNTYKIQAKLAVPYYQEYIIEERVSNFAMGYQKCGPKVHRLPVSLQERCWYACIKFQRLFKVSTTKVLTCSISTCIISNNIQKIT